MIIVCMLLVLLYGPGLSHAHEMGTAALHLTEFSTGSGQLSFKKTRGVSGDIAPISFELLPACKLSNVHTSWEGKTEVQQVAEFHCDQPLDRHSVLVDGFTRLAPDLIVSAHFLDGTERVQIASSTHTLLKLKSDTTQSNVDTDYLGIGIEHILGGMDHVLFVTGLFLLWRQHQESLKALIGRFTVFTLAHSVTLALLVLGWITVPARAIEALIALSVLWVAFELLEDGEGNRPFSTNWVVAAFGLLHGSGFALSMADRGFPKDSLLSTLLLFNIGIEMGQLLIVADLYVAFLAADRWLVFKARYAIQWLLTVLMGGSALYWTIERVMVYV